LSIFVVVLIAVFTLREAPAGLREIGVIPMLAGRAWRPQQGQPGILSMIAGSILVTFGAVALAVPLIPIGVIFLAKAAPKAARKVVRPPWSCWPVSPR
jgi:phosphate transport system permease protein